jgi:hypothetical protein
MANGPHHRGIHRKLSKAIRQAAYADLSARCWKCDLTLAERQRTHPDAGWVGGHVIAGQVGGAERAECSTCSSREGASIRNTKSASIYGW